MSQTPRARATLSIKNPTTRKKSEYGNMFPAPKLIDTIEQNLMSEVLNILRECKPDSDFNENFRTQTKIIGIIKSVYNQIQLSYALPVHQRIFDELVKKVTEKLKVSHNVTAIHFENALKGFRPVSSTSQPETPRVSYKA